MTTDHIISPRDAIIDALMALAAELPFESITLAHIAARADMSLGALREHFPSKGAILGAFTRRIDLIVLNETSDDLINDSAKDRLFDVLMRRLDAMAPYRAALRNIRDWVHKDPLTAAPLNSQIINSMRYMLEAAHLNSEGPMGVIILQAMALKWAEVIDVWINDHDDGLGRTMSALDRMLDDGDHWIKRLSGFERLLAPFNNICAAVLRQRPRPQRPFSDRA
jgi:AcrR family transcriptional regulator